MYGMPICTFCDSKNTVAFPCRPLARCPGCTLRGSHFHVHCRKCDKWFHWKWNVRTKADWQKFWQEVNANNPLSVCRPPVPVETIYDGGRPVASRPQRIVRAADGSLVDYYE